MGKKAVSITLDASNLLWLKGRARVLAGGSLSAAVDRLIDDARAGKLGAAETPRSVAGTIDIPDDAALLKTAEDLRGTLHASVSRRVVVGDNRRDPIVSKTKRRK
jgi:hypothetical protein